jgi:dihydrofolate reductase
VHTPVDGDRGHTDQRETGQEVHRSSVPGRAVEPTLEREGRRSERGYRMVALRVTERGVEGYPGYQSQRRWSGATVPARHQVEGRRCAAPQPSASERDLRCRLIRNRPPVHPNIAVNAHEEDEMTATYSFDVFCTLDGYGSYNSDGDWGGYWGKAGPEFLDRRLALHGEPQRMVLGANTFRQFVEMLSPLAAAEPGLDPVNSAMRNLPTTVVSTTLQGPMDWPDATLLSGDAVDVVARLKQESDVPLRSHGSLAMNRSLMAAGLVDRVQVTIFPVLTGRTGVDPIFAGAADFDLELIESRTLDRHTQELTYHPIPHG